MTKYYATATVFHAQTKELYKVQIEVPEPDLVMALKKAEDDISDDEQLVVIGIVVGEQLWQH